MNTLTFFIFLLNRGDFATSTLAPLLCCNKVAICYCRLVIKVKSYFSQVRERSVGAADCSIGCCCCCWDIYGSDGNSNDDISLYEEEWSSLSELIASY